MTPEVTRTGPDDTITSEKLKEISQIPTLWSERSVKCACPADVMTDVTPPRSPGFPETKAVTSRCAPDAAYVRVPSVSTMSTTGCWANADPAVALSDGNEVSTHEVGSRWTKNGLEVDSTDPNLNLSSWSA